MAAAKLRVNAKLSGSGTVTSTLHAVPNTAWVELGVNGIRWTNMPGLASPPLGTMAVTGTAYTWKEIDVSDYVRTERNAGRSLVTFALTNTVASGSVYVMINARESGTNTAP